MKENFTDITVLLDKSTSMSDCIEQTLSGLNEYIEDQKKVDGKCTLSLFTFDTNYHCLFNGVDIQDVKPVTIDQCQPSGCTALMDSLGKSIDDAGQRLAVMKEEDRPSQILVVILTDGEENSSKEYTSDKIKQMITTQQNDFAWNFVFLGADFDAFKTAHLFGVSADNVHNYDKAQTRKTFSNLSSTTRSYRTSKDVTLSNFASKMDKS